jgi:hypothetical protein
VHWITSSYVKSFCFFSFSFSSFFFALFSSFCFCFFFFTEMPITVEKYNTTEAAGADWVSDSLPAFPTWQLLVIAGIVSWLFVAHRWSFTVHLRAVLQPFVLRHVDKGITVVLQIQVQKFFFFFLVNRFENSPSFLSM